MKHYGIKGASCRRNEFTLVKKIQTPFTAYKGTIKELTEKQHQVKVVQIHITTVNLQLQLTIDRGKGTSSSGLRTIHPLRGSHMGDKTTTALDKQLFFSKATS